MRLGLVSDSHGNIVDLQRAVAQMGEVDMIFHMGDFIEDGMEINKWVSVPVVTVMGNMDAFCRWGEELVLTEVEGKRIIVVHGHNFYVKNSLDSLKLKARNEKADLVFFGHSHIPHIEEEDGVVYINPGSTSLPKGRRPKTFALVDIEGDVVRAEIVELASN